MINRINKKYPHITCSDLTRVAVAVQRHDLREPHKEADHKSNHNKNADNFDVFIKAGREERRPSTRKI